MRIQFSKSAIHRRHSPDVVLGLLVPAPQDGEAILPPPPPPPPAPGPSLSTVRDDDSLRRRRPEGCGRMLCRMDGPNGLRDNQSITKLVLVLLTLSSLV